MPADPESPSDVAVDEGQQQPPAKRRAKAPKKVAAKKPKRKLADLEQTLIIKVPPNEKSKSDRVFEKKIRKHFGSEAQVNNETFNEETVKDLVFKQKLAADIFTLLPEQNLVIRDFVWDKNLRGRTNKRLVEEMFDQLGLENDEIGPKTVVLNKLTNTARTRSEMEKMVEIDPLENVASRLNELMEFFLMRPGANEALEKELSLKK